MNFTSIRWAVNIHDQGRIKELPGISKHVFERSWRTLEEGQIITHPYLVDPDTLEPIPVIVDQLLARPDQPGVLVVIVARPQ